MNNSSKWSFFDGIFQKNPLLFSAMLAAPVAVLCTSVYNAVSYAVVFSIITFFAMVVALVIPKSLAYTWRIIIHTISAAVIYIPVYNIFNGILPTKIDTFGVFAPLIVSSSFVVSSSEVRLVKLTKAKAFFDIISNIIGYCLAIIFIGAIRELIATGGLFGEIYGISHTLPILTTHYCGFIIIGLLSALVRYLSNIGGK